MNDILRAVLRLVIDYFRWTQLIPMLACWGLLLIILFAMAITSLQTRGLDAFEAVVAIVLGLISYLPAALLPRGPEGSIEMSGDDLIDLAAWAWLLLSILAMAINWLVGGRLTPPFLTTLTGRLKTAAVAAALVSIALIAIRLLVPENFNGSFLSWLPTFIGLPLIVWIVSAYSLCVSAVLTLLDESMSLQMRERKP